MRGLIYAQIITKKRDLAIIDITSKRQKLQLTELLEGAVAEVNMSCVLH